jgi:hypothetical protein
MHLKDIIKSIYPDYNLPEYLISGSDGHSLESSIILLKSPNKHFTRKDYIEFEYVISYSLIYFHMEMANLHIDLPVNFEIKLRKQSITQHKSFLFEHLMFRVFATDSNQSLHKYESYLTNNFQYITAVNWPSSYDVSFWFNVSAIFHK